MPVGDIEMANGEQDDPQLALRKRRLIILDALVKAVDRRAEVLAVIFEAVDDSTAREQIAALLAVPEIGATAILELQLRRLSQHGAQRIRGERDELLTHKSR